jgi:excisionase family DNA binding protein
MIMEIELMTTKEAAEYLGVPESTLRWWRHIGTGPPSFTLGRRTVKYKRCDLDAWVEVSYTRTARGEPS